MRASNDIGGLPAGPLDTSAHELTEWDKNVEGTFATLSGKGLMRLHEMRRTIETLGEAGQSLEYYERRCAALMRLVVEKGLLSQDEIDAKVASLRGPQS